MSTKKAPLLMALLSIFLCVVSQLSADVVHEGKTQFKLFGALGTISKIFGLGKPVQTVDYYSGDRLRSDILDDKGKVQSSEIVDLEKELFISLNHKKQKYTQLTFAEWRQQIEEMMKEMEEGKEEPAEEPESQWTVSFDLSKPGTIENVNGREAEKIIMTVIARQKGTAPAEGQSDSLVGGEMRLTSTSWLVSELAGSDEILAFNKKLAEKLGFSFDEAQMKSIWEQIMQSYPQIGDIAETMNEKGQGITGTPIKTYAIYETIGEVKPAGQEGEEETPSSVGGLMKGLGKKALKKDDDGKPKQLIEMTSDVLRQEVTSVDQGLFTVPANYKLEKK